MQFNTFVASIADLNRCAEAPGLQEVLLEPASLARQGQLSDAEVQTLAIAAQARGLRPVLVWDILVPERVMQPLGDRLRQWNLEPFAALRVSDPGAAWWAKTHWPNLPLQLIVEAGNHNLEALRGWCELFADTLERLVLSLELPEAKLVEYCQTLPVGCEWLGVGQILLFYSPRSLLAAHLSTPELGQGSAPKLATTVAFADTPKRQFPTLETVHGTLMFLDRDQFILDRLEGLRQAGLHTVRLDLRHLGQAGDVAVGIEQICRQIFTDPVTLRSQWPRETRAPFFQANRTTALFPRLQSKVSRYRNQACLAEVVAGESKKYLVFYSRCGFSPNQIQGLILPTGEPIPLPADLVLRQLNGEAIASCEPEQLLITDWIKKAVPGSLLLGQD